MGEGWREGFYLPGHRFFYPAKTGYFLLTDNVTVAQRVPFAGRVAEDGTGRPTRLADGRVLLQGSQGWFLMQNHGDHFEQIAGPAPAPQHSEGAASPVPGTRSGPLVSGTLLTPEQLGGRLFFHRWRTGYEYGSSRMEARSSGSATVGPFWCTGESH